VSRSTKRPAQKRQESNRKRQDESEILEEYPEERPGLGFPLMAIAGMLILGAGVLIAWLLSGPDFDSKAEEAATGPTPVMTPDPAQPGSGLEVRRAEQINPQSEQVAVASRVDGVPVVGQPVREGEQVKRAVPLNGTPTPPVAQPVNPTVSAPDNVDVRMDSGENAAVQREVLRRIDAMPNLSMDSKDKLYARVNRTQGMGKVATINFGVGAITPDSAAVSELRNIIQQAQAKPFAEDPTVVFVVLGYADQSGDPAKNLKISLQRADSVVDVLRQDLGVQNITHAVGMGGSNFLDPNQAAKNRAAEVWAVLP